MDTFSDLESTLSAASGMTGWTWHDFRRSLATALGEAGIPQTVADAVLNHRQSATRDGVLGVYQRASRWPEQVKAMELLGAVIGRCRWVRTVIATTFASASRQWRCGGFLLIPDGPSPTPISRAQATPGSQRPLRDHPIARPSEGASPASG